VRLVVPDVSIDMPVDPVGVQDDGEMEIPEDADRAGWYRFGPAPSDAEGATVMAGHVDSRRTGIGQFARLRDVAVGSTVTVTTVDGAEHPYRVVDVQQVPKEGAPVAQWFDRTGPARLVLVTCGGAFRRDVGHYVDNVVVTAEPLDG
jgi:LPXTG-site transpeptidase (sortase) family protein